jgi:hypothetical protein
MIKSVDETRRRSTTGKREKGEEDEEEEGEGRTALQTECPMLLLLCFHHR